MKRWIETFYTNITACVAVNRNYTDRFNVERGVRQGDPCSAYIYLICAEILSLLIRNNENIKGISISNEIETVLSQFADDTTIFLDGSKKSFENCIFCLNFFSSMSGLKMNADKTKVVWIGAKRKSDIKFMHDLNFEWNPAVFKVLGIVFSVEINDIVKLNYEHKLRDIQHLLQSWSKRILTPIGKIIVIKNLASSKLVHLFTNLPDPPPSFLSELNKCFYNFLWDGKRAKLSRAYICKNYEDGGIKMLDVNSFLSALKISWLKRVMFSRSLLTKVLFYTCPEMETLNVYGSEYVNVLLRKCNNPFWIDVVKHYKHMYIKCKPENSVEFFGECIHYNINIIRDKKTIHSKELIQSGIITVGHLMERNGNFLSYASFQNKYPGVRINFLEYRGIVEAIRKYKNLSELDFSNEDYENTESGCSKVWRYLKVGQTKNIYSILTNNSVKPPCIKKWENTFSINPSEWKKIFTKPFKTTSDCQLRWFQLRILYRIIPTRKYLFLCKIVETPLCLYCDGQEDSLVHMIWGCPVSQKFWSDLTSEIREKCEHVNNFVCSESLVIFGMTRQSKTDSVMDLIILMAKFYLYKSKLLNTAPSIVTFMRSLKLRYKVEKYRHTVNGQMKNSKFCTSWLPYQALIKEE